jgi:decaprenylphospho-beta-D-ribofuranose 2-oxidase
MSADSNPLAASTPLTGWGGNLRAACELAEPETPPEVMRSLKRQQLIARGLGRSYGDPALNSGGLVVGMRKLDRYLDFDEASATLRCEAGVSLGQIIRDFGPRGFFPMITPGTKYVTIGGCIANDVHGKAHHAQGSFSACVDSMRVLLANADVVSCSRTELSDLFWGSFGGMGLLGIVLSATIRLRRIETTYFKQSFVKVPDLDAMLVALEEGDKQFPYSVATLDVFATGARIGRGVANMADHATRAELPPALAREPLRITPEPRLNVPFRLPEITLNPLSIRILNSAIQYIQSHVPQYAHYESIFYPLDSINNWNRVGGQRGFAQYQFVVPFRDGVHHMREILGAIFTSGEMPYLNVLKRFGQASGGVLSFPCEGYTFAIDFPMRRNTVALLRRLDAMVLEAGGRIYLGKDSYVEAAMFRAMYPRLDEWLAIKTKYDPENVFVSDLGRRVGLVPNAAG